MSDKKKNKKALTTSEKLEAVEMFFLRDTSNPRLIEGMKLTNKEKAVIVRDPRFMDAFDARIFDMFTGVHEATRTELDVIRLFLQRLGLLERIRTMEKLAEKQRQQDDPSSVKRDPVENARPIIEIEAELPPHQPEANA